MEFSERLNDTTLLNLIKQDKLYAFKSLFNKYWKELFLKASQRVDEETAKDLIQELMITVWRRRYSIHTDKSGSLASYLHSGLKYQIITYYAHKASEIRRLEFFSFSSDSSSENILEVKELKDIIEQKVSELPLRMQRVFRMSREEDISIKEIASRLNLSEQTVKNQLTSALKRLREELKIENISDYAL